MALADQGLTPHQIAGKIGIPYKTVAAFLSSARARRRARSSYQSSNRTIVIPCATLDALAPHAARRGISVNALIRQLVETIVDDRLVDAILDDRAGAGGREAA